MSKHKHDGKHHDHESPEATATVEAEVLRGVVLHYNFSPRGGAEGLILSDGEQTVQVNVPPEAWPSLGLSPAIGQSIEIAVVPEKQGPRHAVAEHPVYRLVSRETSGGPGWEEAARLEGIVARLNYTRHGEVNGVVLDNGDFVHLKPDGMKKVGLLVGQRVAAQGKARSMPMGHRVIEAEVVNGVVLAPRWLHH